MPRKESKVVPEGNGPVAQEETFGYGESTLAGSISTFAERFDRQLKSCFDRWGRKLDEMREDWRSMDHRLIRLERDARQPRLTMKADRPANTKTRERKEGAAKAVQAMHGDSFSTSRVDSGPLKLNQFRHEGRTSRSPLQGWRSGRERRCAPKSCLPSLEMRSPTATGGLLPTGEASIATRTTFNQPSLRLYSIEETHSKKISTPYVSHGSSFFQNNNLPAALSCRGAIETKSRQNKMFDPGGSQGHLRACPFLGSWRALLC